MKAKKQRSTDVVARRAARTTKKQRIIAAYLAGTKDVEELAQKTGARASYVGTILQNAGLLHGYFDLYTSTAHPMNVYSPVFARKLGFKDEATARRSVKTLEQGYQRYARVGDRAGQHHALAMALVMFDRARWSGRLREAGLFRQWLVDRLTLDAPAGGDETPATAPGPGGEEPGP